MRFAVLLYQDETVWESASPEERQAYLDGHADFGARARRRGCEVVAGEALRTVAAATTVRRRGDDVGVTDGPFAETVEQLGGLYLVDAPDVDTLVEVVAALPEHTVELRPVAHV